MDQNRNFFYSKVLLFGEYTVTNGSEALAMPLDRYGGHWSYTIETNESKTGLSKLFDFLSKDDQWAGVFDLDRFVKDINDGLYFDSTIPTGYGLGSSGALVAAFYEHYALDKSNDPAILKNLFANVENAFHGASSGIDPLVSYLGTSLYIRKDSSIAPISLNIKEKGFFLLDTGITRATSPLVSIFKNKMSTQPEFRTEVQRLSATNSQIINKVIHNNFDDLEHEMRIISEIQFKYFEEMIPESMMMLWEKSLSKRDFYLKLCGAGGGGMMMGWAKDIDSFMDGYTGTHPVVRV